MVIICLSILLFTVFDRRSEGDDQQEVTVDEVKQEFGEAIDTVKEFTVQQKEEYQKEAKRRLKEIKENLEDIKARADKLKTDSKIELKNEIENLDKKKDEAEAALAELTNKSGKAWNDMKSGLDKALDEMDEAYRKALSRFE
jgi:DNA anti-recombination protein RmuC